MGKAEERKEPTFPLSYWNDAVDIDLGPLPEHLKRPEQRGEEHAREEVASMAQTAVDQAMQQEAVTQAQPNSQRGKTWATQEAAPPLEAPPASEGNAGPDLGSGVASEIPARRHAAHRFGVRGIRLLHRLRPAGSAIEEPGGGTRLVQPSGAGGCFYPGGACSGGAAVSRRTPLISAPKISVVALMYRNTSVATTPAKLP